jgi:hypothetical protein
MIVFVKFDWIVDCKRGGRMFTILIQRMFKTIHNKNSQEKQFILMRKPRMK